MELLFLKIKEVFAQNIYSNIGNSKIQNIILFKQADQYIKPNLLFLNISNYSKNVLQIINSFPIFQKKLYKNILCIY